MPNQLKTVCRRPQQLAEVDKCKKFLKNLINLATNNFREDQDGPEIAASIRKLVTALVDNRIAPREFTQEVRVHLRSESTQPALVPFLEVSNAPTRPGSKLELMIKSIRYSEIYKNVNYSCRHNSTILIEISLSLGYHSVITATASGSRHATCRGRSRKRYAASTAHQNCSWSAARFTAGQCTQKDTNGGRQNHVDVHHTRRPRHSAHSA